MDKENTPPPCLKEVKEDDNETDESEKVLL